MLIIKTRRERCDKSFDTSFLLLASSHWECTMSHITHAGVAISRTVHCRRYTGTSVCVLNVRFIHALLRTYLLIHKYKWSELQFSRSTSHHYNYNHHRNA
jgi:hypothetical protein